MNEYLNILMNSEDFISGEEISKRLGVSRTAVWKQINKLKEMGYEIRSVSNKGYKLIGKPNHFQLEELMNGLKDCSIVDEIKLYKTIDSTNQEAKRVANKSDLQSGLFIAEEQTMGKGRRGRNWVSLQGDGIYMSLMIRPSISPNHASMLTLVAGLAVLKGIEAVTSLHPLIKWPNDLVLNGRKICGILTELSSEIESINHVVIGIGINVNQITMDTTIQEIATSLRIEGGMSYSRNELVIRVIQEFEQLYHQFLQSESIAFMLEEYNRCCINTNRQVKVEMNGKIFQGKAIRVNGAGELLLITDQGEEMNIHAGEVSVRGLYGYAE